MTIEYRFNRHIRKQEDGHWIWLGGKNNRGYGQMKINNIMCKMHRVSMYLYKGFDLTSNDYILHKLECNIRSCCNPDHLYIGTQYDNMRDRVKSGNNPNLNKMHCPRGHEYNEENTK